MRNWEEKITSLLERLDFYDMLDFLPDALGGREEAQKFILAAIRVRQYSQGYAQTMAIRQGRD